MRFFVMVPLLASAVGLLGCQGKLYFGKRFFALKDMRVRLARPLARSVRFVYFYELGGRKLFASDRATRSRVEAGSFSIPAPTARASEKIGARARTLLRSKVASERSLGAQLSGISSAALRAEAAVKSAAAAADVVLGTTAAVIGALAKAGRASLQSGAEATVAQLTRATGAVGPQAPPGSVLYVFLYARSKKASGYSGYRGYVLASLTLKRGDGATIRSVELMPFERRKDKSVPPASYKLAANGGILVPELKKTYVRGFPHDQMLVLGRNALRALAASAK